MIGYNSLITAQSNTCTELTCDELVFADQLSGCDCFEGCDRLDCGQTGWSKSFREKTSDRGITFSNNLTQFYYGNVSGVVDETARYGGHGDYVANVDFGKLGIHQGLFLKVRAEHRFGSSITGATGALLPPTLATELPVADSRDLYLTNNR